VKRITLICDKYRIFLLKIKQKIEKSEIFHEKKPFHAPFYAFSAIFFVFLQRYK